jgi:hypothetical protein
MEEHGDTKIFKTLCFGKVLIIHAAVQVINSDGCQNGLRYRFAHASHHIATLLITIEAFLGAGDTPKTIRS